MFLIMVFGLGYRFWLQGNHFFAKLSPTDISLIFQRGYTWQNLGSEGRSFKDHIMIVWLQHFSSWTQLRGRHWGSFCVVEGKLEGAGVSQGNFVLNAQLIQICTKSGTAQSQLVVTSWFILFFIFQIRFLLANFQNCSTLSFGIILVGVIGLVKINQKVVLWSLFVFVCQTC